jgi:hypothetical protein
MNKLTDFAKGIIIGFCIGIIVVGLMAALLNHNRKDRELIEYVEKQQAIETMREDYVNRDPYEFIDDFPGVRRASDGASAEFIRKRDEALQRLRDRLTD